MPLFAALVWLLARDARRPDRRIWLVLPLLALWANLHGSVLLACALVLLRSAIGIGIAVRARDLRGLASARACSHSPRCSPRSPRPTGSACCATTARRSTSSGFHELIAEWSGTTFRGRAGVLPRRHDRGRLSRASRGEAAAVRHALPRRAGASRASTRCATSSGCRSPRSCCSPLRSPRWSPEPVSRSRLRPAARDRRARRRARRRRARCRPLVALAAGVLAAGGGQRDRHRGRPRPEPEGAGRRRVRGLAALAAPRAARPHRVRRPLRAARRTRAEAGDPPGARLRRDLESPLQRLPARALEPAPRTPSSSTRCSRPAARASSRARAACTPLLRPS